MLSIIIKLSAIMKHGRMNTSVTNSRESLILEIVLLQSSQARLATSGVAAARARLPGCGRECGLGKFLGRSVAVAAAGMLAERAKTTCATQSAVCSPESRMGRVATCRGGLVSTFIQSCSLFLLFSYFLSKNTICLKLLIKWEIHMIGR